MEHAGSYVLGNELTVAHVSIGISRIEVSNVKVWDKSLPDQTLIEIAIIRIAPSVWTGVRTGNWFQYLWVEDPRVELQFDAAGNLLSQLPSFTISSDSQDTAALRLPRMLVGVKNFELLIHQHGKETLTISQCHLRAEVADRIKVKLTVGDVLGSRLTAHTDLDPVTFVGKSEVTLTQLSLDSSELSRLALVPAAIQSAEMQANFDIQCTIRHPGVEHALVQHQLVLQANLRGIESPLISQTRTDPSDILEGNRVEIRASTLAGQLECSVHGDIAEEQFELRCQSNLVAPIPTIIVDLDVNHLQLKQFAGKFLPTVPIETVASAEGQIQASWQNRRLTFSGNLKQRLSDILIDGIPVADVTTSIECNGILPELDVAGLAGELRIDSHSAGVDLAALSQQLPGLALRGQFEFGAALDIPLATLVDISTYTATAQLQSTELEIDGLHVSPLELVAKLRQGELAAEVLPCRLTCLAPSLRAPKSLVQTLGIADSARVEFEARASAPVLDLLNPATWSMTSSLQTRAIAVHGEQLADMRVEASWANGKFQIPEQQIHWRDSTLTFGASGDAETSGDKMQTAFTALQGSLELHFDSSHIPLDNVASTLNRYSHQPIRLTGMAGASGLFTVDLPSGDFRGTGEMVLKDAHVNNTRVGAARLNWSADRRAFHLVSQSQHFLGGAYHLDARLPSLDWTQTTIDGNFTGIQLKRLSDYARSQLITTGSVEGQIHIDSIQDLHKLNADLRLSSRDASVAGIPLQFNTGQTSVRNGRLQFESTLSALDGNCTLSATGKLQDIVDWAQVPNSPLHRLPVTGSLLARNISLQRASDLIDHRRAARHLSGQIEIKVERDKRAAEKGIVASATTSLSNIRWQNSMVANRIFLNALIFPDRVEVNSIEGLVAEGRLSGRTTLSIDRNPKGTFQLAVENINLRRATSSVPSLAKSLSGTASLSCSGQVGVVSRASIKVQASGIHAGDLAIREIRLPLTMNLDMRSQRLEVHCRNGSINAGGGYVYIDTEGSWANGMTSATTNVDIRNIDSTKLLRGGALSVGIINGQVQLSCARARNPEDVTGKYHIELTQLQNLELPGYDQFTQLVKMPTFSKPSLGEKDIGILDGRLGGGLIHLDQATLTKSGLLVLADGTVTMQGRLAMDIVAITNPSGPADGLVELASSPLMLATPAPIALLAKANAALKDRTFHLAVAGTTSRPVLHIQPGKGLSQDAMRFVISTTFGSQAADIAASQSRPIKR